LSNGSFVVGHHGVQPLGAMVMEREVAEAVADRLASKVPALLPKDDIDELLLSYEKAERIELNEAQWEAVHLAAAKPFVLITGGAGVGKTTVLKGLYEVYDRTGLVRDSTGPGWSSCQAHAGGHRSAGFDHRQLPPQQEGEDLRRSQRGCRR
jgi:hypothetical protein